MQFLSQLIFQPSPERNHAFHFFPTSTHSSIYTFFIILGIWIQFEEKNENPLLNPSAIRSIIYASYFVNHINGKRMTIFSAMWKVEDKNGWEFELNNKLNFSIISTLRSSIWWKLYTFFTETGGMVRRLWNRWLNLEIILSYFFMISVFSLSLSFSSEHFPSLNSLLQILISLLVQL